MGTDSIRLTPDTVLEITLRVLKIEAEFD